MQCFIKTALAAAIVLAAATPALAQPGKGSAEVERGRYLVLSVAGCNDCHTPMTPRGPDMAHSLQGAALGFKPVAPMPWAANAPAIASGPKGFTRAQFVSFLQTGKRPNGSSPPPPMPAYRMTVPDAQAVVAYISTLPAKSR